MFKVSKNHSIDWIHVKDRPKLYNRDEKPQENGRANEIEW